MNATPVAGEVARLSPRVRRITQNNPGIFTGAGTNTHLVGTQALFIIDPGADDPVHFERLVQAIGATPVLAVIPTHSHRDHWPLASRLAEHYGVETLGLRAQGGYTPQRTLRDGERLEGPDVTLQAVHTPGHASDHLCYLVAEEDALLSGDHVMGWSTSVIVPPDGNLNDYLATLGRLRDLDLRVMYPAHGPPVHDPRGRVEELVAHRHQRTREALSALGRGLNTIPAMVQEIYAEVDPRLHPAAAQSLLAHLLALEEEGTVVVTSRHGDPLQSRYRVRK